MLTEPIHRTRHWSGMTENVIVFTGIQTSALMGNRTGRLFLSFAPMPWVLMFSQ